MNSTHSDMERGGSDNQSRNPVLLIHGTGAADASDTGDSWWQRESHFWHELRGKVGDVTNPQPRDQVFHWSGANSESERRKAGAALYRELRALEDVGRAYHLIGHSHGGSVIWHALKLSAEAGRRLDGLRSWASVATPYLTYSAVRISPWLVMPAIVIALAIASLFPGVDPLFRRAGEMWREGDWIAVVAMPVFWLLLLSGGGLLLHRLLRALNSRRQLHSDRKAAATALCWYGDRWLGLWSSEDEAINGLTNTLGLGGEIIPRAEDENPGHLRTAISTVLSPLRFVYNRLFADAGDTFIWSRLQNRLQGNDWPGAQLISVGNCPVPGRRSWPSLPVPVHETIMNLVNEQSAQTLQDMRRRFGVAAEARWQAPELVDGIKSDLTWNELVHTTYFQIPAVANLLAAHIRRHAGAKSLETPDPLDDELTNWLVRGPHPDGADENAIPRRPTKQNQALNVVGFGLLAIAAAFVWFSAQTIHTANVRPYTDEYQIERLIEDVPVLFIQDHYDDLIIDWYRALGRADRAPTPQSLDQTAKRLAFREGPEGIDGDIDSMIGSVRFPMAAAIAEGLGEIGETTKAASYLQIALEDARREDYELRRNKQLVTVVEIAARLDQFGLAEQVAREVTTYEREYAYAALSDEFLKKGRHAKSLSILNAVIGDVPELRARLIRSQIANKRLDEALPAVDILLREQSQKSDIDDIVLMALSEMALAFETGGNSTEAARHWSIAKELADKSRLHDAFCVIANRLLNAKHTLRAWELWLNSSNKPTGVGGNCDTIEFPLFSSLVNEGQWREADEVFSGFRNIHEGHRRTDFSSSIKILAEKLSEPDEDTRTSARRLLMKLVEEQKSGDAQAQDFIIFMNALPKGVLSEHREFLENELSRAVPDEVRSDQLGRLANLVRATYSMKLTRLMLSELANVYDEEVKSRLIVAAVTALSHHGHFREARRIANQARLSVFQLMAYTEILNVFASQRSGRRLNNQSLKEIWLRY